ncbi:MAG TPA: A/G-specific adenine glycosylase, partial [Patescibacteria group bacterium]|nr:A/G-specific adenine glycosylase [Patescibacteria group bacterium]
MRQNTAGKLLQWYRRYGRELPWRKTRDPYNILVSEIMLQQTQVDRVCLFYPRWLKQFPTWKKLASATTPQILSAWAGLGYNRRALMLREIARRVVKSGVPKSEEEWCLLKGIGSYTASAISAFSEHKRTLPIDTNIRRVLARVLLGLPYPELKDDVAIRQAAEPFLPTRVAYYDVPQALFDLATNVCTKMPDCARCPLQSDCQAAKKFLSGTVKIPKQM